MKLTELSPRWVKYGEGRQGMGISFISPKSEDDGLRIAVWFKNPIDGGEPINDKPTRCLWERTGDTFENLSLTPSVDASPAWHGWITNGEAK